MNEKLPEDRSNTSDREIGNRKHMNEKLPEDRSNTSDQDIVSVKQLRKDIDAITQSVKELSLSRERSIVITKLQEATMWLGMDLKRISEARPEVLPNPYPNSKDPSNTVVDKTADGLKL